MRARWRTRRAYRAAGVSARRRRRRGRSRRELDSWIEHHWTPSVVSGARPFAPVIPGRLACRFALLFDTAVPRQPLSEGRTPKRLLALGDRRGTATHATGVRCAQLVDGLYPGRRAGASRRPPRSSGSRSARSSATSRPAPSSSPTGGTAAHRDRGPREAGARPPGPAAPGARVDRLPGGGAATRPRAAAPRGRHGAGGSSSTTPASASNRSPVPRTAQARRPEAQVLCDPFVEKQYRHLDETIDSILRGPDRAAPAAHRLRRHARRGAGPRLRPLHARRLPRRALPDRPQRPP